MAVTHSTVVVVADDGTSPVGTDEWNDDHDTATISLSGTSANKDQLIITDTTAGAGLTIGGDVSLYRAAPGFLRTAAVIDTEGGLRTDVLTSYSGAGVTTNDRLELDGGDAGATKGLQFGSTQDTNLYRSAANTLKTDDALIVVGAITQNAGKTVLDTDHTAAADPHSTYFKTISFGGNLV